MSKGKVVIIEDDPDLREALVRQLRDEDFEVFSAKDGQDGLRRVTQVKPDLIMLDLLMPEMDGHAMMQELLDRHEWVRQIPVLVLTNYGFGDKPIEDWAEQVQMSFVVKSDLSLKEIANKVEEMVLHKQRV